MRLNGFAVAPKRFLGPCKGGVLSVREMPEQGRRRAASLEESMHKPLPNASWEWVLLASLLPGYSTSPSRTATMAAWVLSETPSLPMML